MAAGRAGLDLLKDAEDLVAPHPDGFAAEYSSVQLGHIALHVVDMSPVLIDRGPARIAERPHQELHLGFVIDGQANLTQHGRTVQCRPGDMAFRTSNEPYTVVVPRRSRFVQIGLPLNGLGHRIRGLRQITAVRLGFTPLVQATGHLLQMLAAALPTPGTRAAHHAERAVVDITGALIDELTSATLQERTDSDLLGQVTSYVQRNIGNSRLGARQIAHHLGIGLEQLQRLVSVAGVSVDQYILQIRLDAATEQLKNPDRPSLKQIADETGFRSSDDLGRQMRRHLGTSPTQFRLDLQAKDDA